MHLLTAYERDVLAMIKADIDDIIRDIPGTSCVIDDKGKEFKLHVHINSIPDDDLKQYFRDTLTAYGRGCRTTIAALTAKVYKDLQDKPRIILPTPTDVYNITGDPEDEN